MAKTYSLEAVAADYLPEHWTDGRRWLARRISRGELKGVRFGRTWRMRDSDIEFMLTKFSNDDQVAEHQESDVASPQPSFADSLSPRSRARLRRIQ